MLDLISSITTMSERSSIFMMLFIVASSLIGISSIYQPVNVETQPQNQSQPQQQQQNTDLSLSTLMSQGSPLLGDPAAPVTIIDFSDFQCYTCARYVKATEPLINQTYIQSGEVALVFKHLPNRGFDSMGASLAAQCANDQGKFWQSSTIV
jgi:protein-disulfide isomerase